MSKYLHQMFQRKCAADMLQWELFANAEEYTIGAASLAAVPREVDRHNPKVLFLELHHQERPLAAYMAAMMTKWQCLSVSTNMDRPQGPSWRRILQRGGYHGGNCWQHQQVQRLTGIPFEPPWVTLPHWWTNSGMVEFDQRAPRPMAAGWSLPEFEAVVIVAERRFPGDVFAGLQQVMPQIGCSPHIVVRRGRGEVSYFDGVKQAGTGLIRVSVRPQIEYDDEDCLSTANRLAVWPAGRQEWVRAQLPGDGGPRVYPMLVQAGRCGRGNGNSYYAGSGGRRGEQG